MLELPACHCCVYNDSTLYPWMSCIPESYLVADTTWKSVEHVALGQQTSDNSFVSVHKLIRAVCYRSFSQTSSLYHTWLCVSSLLVAEAQQQMQTQTQPSCLDMHPLSASQAQSLVLDQSFGHCALDQSMEDWQSGGNTLCSKVCPTECSLHLFSMQCCTLCGRHC